MFNISNTTLVSAVPVSSDGSTSSSTQKVKPVDQLGTKLISSMLPRLPDITKLKDIELPEATIERLIFGPLEEMAKKAEKIFKKANDEGSDSDQFVDFASKEFLNILASIVKEADQLPPNNIAECDVNEAVFTHALDRKPIIATHSLATCVGVAGYESESKFGFVIHIATESDLKASEEMLTKKMMEMSKGAIKKPIQLHLRGGIAGKSELLVQAIEKWVKAATENGCPMVIASKEVLTKGFLNTLGVPNTMSISLDTRNGTLSSYDPSTNPYGKQRLQINSEQELDNVLSNLFSKSILKKSGIKILYPSCG